jgi:hypothetical protein
MKFLRFGLVITVAAVISLGFGGIAMAFHDGGVAHCDGCHTMHNSEDGESIIDGGVVGTAGISLTLGSDPSSVCLNCHKGSSGSYRVLTSDGSNLYPGGDFFWQDKTVQWTRRGSLVTRNGYSFGHSIIAADYGLTNDPDLGTAPGGTYPSSQLYCSSCHDPHGKKINKSGPIVASGSYRNNWDTYAGQELGNYRILADIGYSPGTSGVTFTARPPIATTPSFGGYPEADDSHTDYGSGMSEWCANCHTGFLNQSIATHRHVAGDNAGLTAQIAANYNSYVKTGDLTGNQANSYWALVPFERGTNDPTATDPTSTAGPTSANVACISCHRAHVSAFPNAGRWDFETEFIVDSHPQAGDGGTWNVADPLAPYYNRDPQTTWGDGQRSFCNKCHVQD